METLETRFEQKKSEIQAGATNTVILLGHGKWELTAASANPEGSVPMIGSILFGTTKDGTNRWTHLVSGYATFREPLVLVVPRIFTGPAFIVSNFVHPAATDEHTLHVAYRRIT